MAARSQRLTLIAIAVLMAVAAAPQPSPRRIVSLVPSLTEALFAIGAGPQVIAVSSYDTYPAAVKALPHVGALLDPDTERILSLHPDLVVVYGSQSTLEQRLAHAGIRTYSYRHGGLTELLGTFREIGGLTGHSTDANRLVTDLQARLDATRARVTGRGRPKTLLVFGRQAGTLREIYASGGVGFLHDMLEIAGGGDVFADVKRESVQPSTEMLIARAPDVILEVNAEAPQGGVDAVRRAWSALPSIPAVRSGRIYELHGDYLVVPGPRLAQGVEAMARALHPEAYR